MSTYTEKSELTCVDFINYEPDGSSSEEENIPKSLSGNDAIQNIGNIYTYKVLSTRFARAYRHE